nr:ATP-binding cassette domain-containing protein [Cryptosporangium aurantiacum]
MRESTLLHLLGGLQRPTGGEVWLADHRLDTMSERALARLRRAHIGFVFQSFHLMDDLTAVENVELAALLAGRPAGRGSARCTCWIRSGLPTAPRTCRPRSPVVSGNGSRSPAH